MNLFLVWLCFLYEFGTCTGLIYAWFDSCRGLIHQTHTYKIDEIIFSYL